MARDGSGGPKPGSVSSKARQAATAAKREAAVRQARGNANIRRLL